jgi:hypothetical protein
LAGGKFYGREWRATVDTKPDLPFTGDIFEPAPRLVIGVTD